MEIPYGQIIADISLTLKKLELDHVVCGGSVVPLLITSGPYYPFRATDDIDLLIPLEKQSQYSKIEEQLRSSGFENDVRENAPICRWLFQGRTVDIMPTPGEFIGLKTKWFSEALQTAWIAHIHSMKVPVISATGFIACKYEAFKDRGKGDYSLSHDIEDIIAVVDQRSSLADELGNVSDPLVQPAREALKELSENRDFEFILRGHLPPDPGNQARVPHLMQRVQEMLR